VSSGQAFRQPVVLQWAAASKCAGIGDLGRGRNRQVRSGIKQRVFDCDEGLGRSAPVGDTRAFCGEVGSLRSDCRERCDAQGSLEILVAGLCFGEFDASGGFIGPWNASPGCQVPGGSEHGHVGAGFGDEDLCDGGAESRDADQAFPGGTKGFHRLLDPGTQVLDVCRVGVDPVQIKFCHVAVVAAEPAREGAGELRGL